LLTFTALTNQDVADCATECKEIVKRLRLYLEMLVCDPADAVNYAVEPRAALRLWLFDWGRAGLLAAAASTIRRTSSRW
jgi:hypothetical protein